MGGCVVAGHPISNLRSMKLDYFKSNSNHHACGTGKRYVSFGSEYKTQRGRGRVRGSKCWSCEEVMSELEADLPRLFEEEGIDKDMYEKNVQFRDPITKHDTLDGYLFNIRLLRLLFRPLFHLHSLRQTGPFEITTRWTMVMTFGIMPWKPRLVFTGTSVMGLNPQTGKFCSHVDYWDSIKQNDYFSFEGFMDVVKQLFIFKTPDVGNPKYQILKRTADYEVRKYEPFVVIETKCDTLMGSSGFDNVTSQYTLTIFNQTAAHRKCCFFISSMFQVRNHPFSIPSKPFSSLPESLLDGLMLRKIQDNVVAVTKFNGKAKEEVYEKEKKMRASLIRDGIQPKPGCILARYSDPNRMWSFIMRNEVLIWLDTFVLE